MNNKKAKVTDIHREEARLLRELWHAKKPCSQAEFGERFEIGNQAAVSQFLTARTPLSLNAAIGFASGLGVRISDFSERLASEAKKAALADEGMDAAGNERSSIQGFTPLPNKTPLVTIARYPTGGTMGNGGVMLNDEVGAIESWQVSKRWVSENIRNYTAAENLCIVTGYGDSMRPTFNPGDPLIIDRGVKTVEFDAVYFFRIDSQGYIKRLQRIPTANGLVLSAISDNRKAYDSFPITEDMNFEVIGRVLQIWRREDF